MTEPPIESEIAQPPNHRGIDMQPGSLPRYVAALSLSGLVAILWAFVWAAAYTKHDRLDLACLNIVIGICVGYVFSKIWGVGGAVAAINALLIAIFSVGLGHLILFEYYALNQQAADDIGISPSFRTVMAHFHAIHWIWCSFAIVGALWMPLRRK